MSQGLTAGFADPVRDAQHCFRTVLDAMSRPGRIGTVAGVEPPPPLCSAAAAVLLTLADHETALWLDPDAAASRDWIAFHCGTPLTGDTRQAAFALALGMPDPARFFAGTHEGPESSATVIVQLPALTGGPALRLRGPGLKTSAILAPVGLPTDFPMIWRRNRGLFPAGIDLILCAGDSLAALPRTVSVEEA
jgi:alpha-D-ribose 1-methylphosphonate 5-triphosphate synthase subunit PhnH